MKKSIPPSVNQKSKKEISFDDLPPDLVQIHNACLSHARDLINAAKRILKKRGLSNIAYHLAILALEEIGKAELVMMGYLAKKRDDAATWPEKGLENHVRKLFWALWGPSFGRDLITGEQIEQYRGLAKLIHEKRLRGLYVNPGDDIFVHPRRVVTRTETLNLIKLAYARLKLKTEITPRRLDRREAKNLSWFLEASNDEDQRRLIMGAKSMEKLKELGSPRSWIDWLHDEFKKAEAKGRAQAERELRRVEPAGAEAEKEKWSIKIRFYTNSHSVRQRPLNSWNKVSNWIKLYAVDRKKDQLLAEFIFPKSVSINSLWWVGWGSARRFITALNIGSIGFFWWYIPEQISRFYEDLRDLDENAHLAIERQPILKLEHKRGALNEQDINNTALCFGMLPGPNDVKKHKPFDLYLTGLGFLSKNDIHLQFELNAYDCFYRSLKSGMEVFGDWDAAKPFEDAFEAFTKDIIPDAEQRREFLELGRQFEIQPCDPKGITLNEVGGMKLLCDAYFLERFRRLAKEKNKEEPEFETRPESKQAKKERDK